MYRLKFIGWRRRDLEDLYTDERKDDGKMASKLTHSPEYWRTSGCNACMNGLVESGQADATNDLFF